MTPVMGWRKDKRDGRDRVFAVRKPDVAMYPPEVDLSPFLPSVRHQGNLGSCVGFGIAANLTGTAKQRGVYSEWFSPTWIYNGARLLDSSLGEDIGAYPRDALDFIRHYGCLLEHFRKYRDVLDPTDPREWTYDGQSVRPEAAKHPVFEYVRVVDGVDGIQGALAEGYLVSLGSPWYGSWTQPFLDGTLPEDYTYIVGGHATLLYGYDAIERVFYGQNSWGKDWAVDGRFKMPFSAIERFKLDGGYDAHYVRVHWIEVEPVPVPFKKFPWWILALGAAALLGLLSLLISL